MKVKQSVPVWVCLSSLVSETVVPVCHGLQGLWVCEYCSCSPPPYPLSLHPLVGPAQHLFCAVGTGQGRGFLATKGYVTTLYSMFFSRSSFVISLTYPFKQRLR